MDEMENRLSMIGLGEMGYFIYLGAIAAGADSREAMIVLTAFFQAGAQANYTPTEVDDEEESDEDESTD
jgi:pyrroline-5-carboxylate reductase